jgi:2-keto-4-pentenoate hydratase
MRRRRLTPLLAAAAALTMLAAAPPRAAQAACPPDEAVEGMARRLMDKQPGEPLAGMTGLPDGQCAQDKLVAILAQRWGRPVGYKVGLTNPTAQQRFGVSHPITGTIFESTLRARDGAEVPARFGAVPAVEADLLVRVRDEGINQARTHAEVLRHIDQVIPFIELPDLVMPPGRLDGPNLLAINVGARLGVVGTPIPVEGDGGDLAQRLGSMTVVMLDDTGKELARAPGTALLGHPLNVLPWLAEDLAKRGRRLRAGEIVSLGGFSPALPVEAGRTYTVRYEGLRPDGQPATVSVRMR